MKLTIKTFRELIESEPDAKKILYEHEYFTSVKWRGRVLKGLADGLNARQAVRLGCQHLLDLGSSIPMDYGQPEALEVVRTALAIFELAYYEQIKPMTARREINRYKLDEPLNNSLVERQR